MKLRKLVSSPQPAVSFKIRLKVENFVLKCPVGFGTGNLPNPTWLGLHNTAKHQKHTSRIFVAGLGRRVNATGVGGHSGRRDNNAFSKLHI